MICQPLHPLSHSYQCRTLSLSTVAMVTVWQGWAVSKALWSLAKTPLHTYLCYVALIPSFWSSFDGDIKPGGIRDVPREKPYATVWLDETLILRGLALWSGRAALFQLTDSTSLSAGGRYRSRERAFLLLHSLKLRQKQWTAKLPLSLCQIMTLKYFEGCGEQNPDVRIQRRHRVHNCARSSGRLNSGTAVLGAKC